MVQIKCEKVIKVVVVLGKVYVFEDVINILKIVIKVKFVELIDVVVCLGVDVKKFDQQVCGFIVLLVGIGKLVCVVVFVLVGVKVDEVLVVGVDVVGMDDLVEKMQVGDLNYDVVIVILDVMCVVGKLGIVLGLCGLMLNLKVGIVFLNLGEVVKNVKLGQVCYCIDKVGIIYCIIGKVDFVEDVLKLNLIVLLLDLIKVKLVILKGIYLQKVLVSLMMGLGVIVDQLLLILK